MTKTLSKEERRKLLKKMYFVRVGLFPSREDFALGRQLERYQPEDIFSSTTLPGQVSRLKSVHEGTLIFYLVLRRTVREITEDDAEWFADKQVRY